MRIALALSLVFSAAPAERILAAPALQLVAATERHATEFATAQRLTVPLSVSAPGDLGVFGLELAFTATTEDITIQAVTIDTAFSEGFDEVSPALISALAADSTASSTAPSDNLPGTGFRALRSQSAASLNRTLGANSQAVPFATVELEIKNSRPFTSALVIHYRGSLVGGTGDSPANTSGLPEQNGDSQASNDVPPTDVGRLVIEIVNTAPPPTPQRTVEVWQQEQAALSAEVRDPATGQPVTTLTAGKQYNLYYDAHGEAVTGYVLFTVANESGHSLAAASVPPSGPWTETGAFAFIPAPAQGAHVPTADDYGPGLYRYSSVGDDRMALGSAAPSAGHLLSFVPQGPGPLRLQLFMRNIDPQSQSIVEMETRLELNVTAD